MIAVGKIAWFRLLIVGAVFNRDYPYNRGWKPLPPAINFYLNDLECYVVSYERRLWPRASSQIEKETNEHRTLNIQHRTSNNVSRLF
jgi:hypothetical protein